MSTRIRQGLLFGRLEAIESLGPAGGGIALWHCRCSCGADAYELSTDLRAGDVVSCGDCPPATRWTSAEDAVMREHYAHTPNSMLAVRLDRTAYAVKTRSTVLGLTKSAAYMRTAASGRIQPGSTPPNKGRKGMPVHPNAQRTQFRKGNRPHTWKPVGTEVVNADGYLVRKISDDGPRQRDNWREVHLLLWEQAGRELPPGHAVCFINGDKTDLRIENLELVSRADLMARNTRHNLPPEVNELIGLRAALVRKINRRERQLDEELDR